jgi:hypothetical protein
MISKHQAESSKNINIMQRKSWFNPDGVKNQLGVICYSLLTPNLAFFAQLGLKLILFANPVKPIFQLHLSFLSRAL